MSILVIFDSNSDTTGLSSTRALSNTTESIAEAVAVELCEGTRAVPVAGLGPDCLTGVELLVVGSPIAGWRPTPRLQAFLGQLRRGSSSRGGASRWRPGRSPGPRPGPARSHPLCVGDCRYRGESRTRRRDAEGPRSR